MIQPKVLKGFRDSLPKQEIVKKKVINILENVFSNFGFVPIDTPILEYKEVLLGKAGGETDKQIFHFVDNGKREVALRFDLTIPFARFVAANYNELTFPFKRFHISKVFRGENPQRGRFREFYQCDFDIVGTDSENADLEILIMMAQALKALDLNRFTIKVSHRNLFNSYLKTLKVDSESTEILRSVDKLAKIGKDEVFKLLVELVKEESIANSILDFISIGNLNDNEKALKRLTDLFGNENEDLNRLKSIFNYLDELNISDNFKIDTSITRGLDYYTAIVFETFLDDYIEIGSICSGGRYDDLASLYTKHHLPGVGSSIGLDRLLAALEHLGHPLLENPSSSEVLVINEGEKFNSKAQVVTNQLRGANIAAQYYLLDRKILNQFKFAEQNNIPYALFLNKEAPYTLRDLNKRTDLSFSSVEEVIKHLKGN